MQPDLQLTWEQVVQNSPILNFPKSAPPLLVTRGEKQTSEFLRQSDDFYNAWTKSSLPGEHWVQTEYNHFDELFPLTESDSELTKKIIKLADS